jgi:hypothetical protein
VGIAGQQADGQAPAVALADQRRARRQRQPLGDRRGQPPGVLGRPEVLGEPALGIDAGELDLPIAVQEHHGGARHRLGGQHAIQALARQRGSQRVLEARVGDVEHIAVALGELALRSAERGDDHFAATGAHANRDLVLHTRRVQQVAVKLAAREESRLDQLGEPHGSAPAGGVGGQERMASRAPHDRLEGAGALRLDRDRVVADGAGGELDTVPGQNVCRDELGERFERATARLDLRPGSNGPPGEPAGGANVGVSKKGHDHHLRRYTSRCALPPSPGRARAPAQAAGLAAAVRRPLRSLGRRRR